MALFRAEVKPISRGKGHNAVAAAAYRAGEKLEDTNPYNPNRTEHDFSKKSDVLHKAILLPQALADFGFSISRQDLWSQVEAHEVTQRGQKMKSNARVAREWLLALPHELSNAENIELAEEFALRMANDLGVIADCCIHDPSLKSRAPAPKPSAKTADREPVSEDERNIHAHIMFTTRKATLNAQNKLLFTDKAECELDGTARKNKGLVKEADYLKEIRTLWADMLNERLIAHGIAPVTAASYQDRNLDVLPTIHTGRNPLTKDKERYNDVINDRNQRVFNERVDTLQRLAYRANGITGITDSVTARRKQSADDLIEQKRRFNQATEQANTESRRLHGIADGWVEQRKYAVARCVRGAQHLKNGLIDKILERGQPKNYLRHATAYDFETPQHENKFDDRQITILNAFVRQHHLYQRENESVSETMKRLKTLTEDTRFFTDNREIFALVGNPKTNREIYNAKTLSEAQQVPLNNFDYPTIKNDIRTQQELLQEHSVSQNVPRFR